MIAMHKASLLNDGILPQEATTRNAPSTHGEIWKKAPGRCIYASQFLAACTGSQTEEDAAAVTDDVASRPVLFSQVVPREPPANGAAENTETVRPDRARIIQTGCVQLTHGERA
ncbi:hypothetical protein TcG_06009 [Trypanosoma cruzi]|nr:hypothetical protein TcG_06009 [Trypanosoma cruzi]